MPDLQQITIEMAENYAGIARGHIENGEPLVPVAFLWSPTLGPQIIALDFHEQEAQDKSLAEVERMAQGYDSAILMADCYVRRLKRTESGQPEPLPEGSLAEDPESIEALVVFLAWRGGRQEWSLPYTRKNDTIIWHEPEREPTVIPRTPLHFDPYGPKTSTTVH